MYYSHSRPAPPSGAHSFSIPPSKPCKNFSQAAQLWNQFAFSAHADPAFALVCRKPWTADRIHESIRRIQLIERKFLAKKEWYSDFSLTKNQKALFIGQLQQLSEVSYSLTPALNILMFCIRSQDINTLIKNSVTLDFVAILNLSISKLKEIEGHLIDLIRSLDKKIKYRSTGYLHKKASNALHGLALFISHITSETEELTDYLSIIRSDHAHKQSHQQEVI